MEVFELRNQYKPLILRSQMSTAKRHKKLDGESIADAILNRAISNVYKLIICGNSQRKVPFTNSNNYVWPGSKKRDLHSVGNRVSMIF